MVASDNQPVPRRGSMIYVTIAGVIAFGLIALAWVATRTEPPTSVEVTIMAIVIAMLIALVFHLNKRIARKNGSSADL